MFSAGGGGVLCLRGVGWKANVIGCVVGLDQLDEALLAWLGWTLAIGGHWGPWARVDQGKRGQGGIRGNRGTRCHVTV